MDSFLEFIGKFRAKLAARGYSSRTESADSLLATIEEIAREIAEDLKTDAAATAADAATAAEVATVAKASKGG